MNDLTAQRLRDALVAAATIQEFLQDVSLTTYEADFRLRLQIERLFEIVGEALNRALQGPDNDEVIQAVPEIRSIIGMRNRIIHGYDKIDNELVWTSSTQKMPVLHAQLASFLGHFGEDN